MMCCPKCDDVIDLYDIGINSSNITEKFCVCHNCESVFRIELVEYTDNKTTVGLHNLAYAIDTYVESVKQG